MPRLMGSSWSWTGIPGHPHPGASIWREWPVPSAGNVGADARDSIEDRLLSLRENVILRDSRVVDVTGCLCLHADVIFPSHQAHSHEAAIASKSDALATLQVKG